MHYFMKTHITLFRERIRVCNNELDKDSLITNYKVTQSHLYFTILSRSQKDIFASLSISLFIRSLLSCIEKRFSIK